MSTSLTLHCSLVPRDKLRVTPRIFSNSDDIRLSVFENGEIAAVHLSTANLATLRNWITAYLQENPE